MKLVAHLDTHGAQYPWEFHCVNDKAINAFALPGGYVFVNRGAIEAADNEAQLAGVMAHELSHVALRHGTNQATKAMLADTVLGSFGAVFGDSAGGALLTTLGSFTAGGVLLRYSRTAESQADVLGTQVLYDFFFSSRRRHTISLCDWSSDVCSSDLIRSAAHSASARSLGSAICRRRLACAWPSRSPATASPRRSIRAAISASARGWAWRATKIGRASCRERV